MNDTIRIDETTFIRFDREESRYWLVYRGIEITTPYSSLEEALRANADKMLLDGTVTTDRPLLME